MEKEQIKALENIKEAIFSLGGTLAQVRDAIDANTRALEKIAAKTDGEAKVTYH